MRLLIAGLDNDTPTSSRVSLTWLDVVKGFFFNHGNNFVIMHFSCDLSSVLVLLPDRFIWVFLPNFGFTHLQQHLFVPHIRNQIFVPNIMYNTLCAISFF